MLVDSLTVVILVAPMAPVNNLWVWYVNLLISDFIIHSYCDFGFDCMTCYDRCDVRQCDVCKGHSFLQPLTLLCFREQLAQTSLSLGWLMMM